ncbi:DUF4347 domain-containing protein [Microcoleus sp. LEGE 07076]|uniref:DUF4347 domain-containing protein n=1 Tax=Microcoleus sp. LEGE 07076 TaxID=915322 RepID=UPI00187F152D|nr:DUF4347 domain-containing protein [Microcoleus sp. LEGE 07076]MBE9186355.1 DUF4347 domain-containing protein [Microcoleus sp. LEGE 07076]
MKNQIVFVDAAVEDWQSLAAGVKPGIEVILVDRAGDGIAQISQALHGRNNIESVHIISHGESGSLQLGQTNLNLDNLETYRDCLQRWFSASVNSIQHRFEILLYGCNVAAGEKGAAFVQQLSKLTKAKIAASADATGNAQKGGNWLLEYATGAIKTGLAIEPEVMANYAHTLAIFTVSNTLIGGTGSDRFMLGIDLGSETILDFQDGTDSIGLMGGLNFSQLSIVAENSSTLIRVTGSGQLLATLSNVPTSLITATDFALL